MASSGDHILSIPSPILENPSYHNEKKHSIITQAEVQSVVDETKRKALRRLDTFEPVRDRQETSLYLTKAGAFFYKIFENRVIRWIFYIVPIAALLCIPIALCATVYKDARVGGIRLLGLFIWIEVLWCNLWAAKIVSVIIPFLFQSICGLFVTGVRRWFYLLRALEIPLSLFLWAAGAYASKSIVWSFDDSQDKIPDVAWLQTFTKVLRATILIAALYLAEKVIIQMVSSNYHSRQFDTKIREIKNLRLILGYMYDASIKKFPQFHPSFFEIDSDLRAATDLRKLRKQGTFQGKALDYLNMLGWYGDKYITSAVGSMASDITGTSVLKPTASQAIVEKALESRVSAEALALRIYLSFITPGTEALYETDIAAIVGVERESDAQFIFEKLDKDDNGDVSQDEMVRLVTELSRQSKLLWRGAADVKDAIKILDRVLSFFVVIITALIYAAFFSNYLATKYTQIWTTFTGLSFLFANTAGELFAACILVFIKHPYDVGDRVNINKESLEVVRISLLYTVFRRIESDTLVQIANSAVNSLWIDNVTRSRGLRESYKFKVFTDTTFEQIELLRCLLEDFVRSPDNKRDYQPTVDIKLVSLDDMKSLELQVDFRHKSNWAIDSIRSARRCKFMCALLSAIKKVPIEAPGGDGPFPRTSANPDYFVTVTPEEHKARKAEFDEKKAAKKFVPLVEVEGQAVSTALEILPNLQNRRGSAVAPAGI